MTFQSSYGRLAGWVNIHECENYALHTDPHSACAGEVMAFCMPLRRTYTSNLIIQIMPNSSRFSVFCFFPDFWDFTTKTLKWHAKCPDFFFLFCWGAARICVRVPRQRRGRQLLQAVSGHLEEEYGKHLEKFLNPKIFSDFQYSNSVCKTWRIKEGSDRAWGAAKVYCL